MPACPNCTGTLGVEQCQHGDATDRAFRALAHVAEERGAARDRKEAGLPVNVQEGGERYDRAGKREGVSGSYVRRLEQILETDNTLAEEVRGKKLGITEAWMKIRRHGDVEDPDTWLTPAAILNGVRLASGGRIDLDPATLAANPTGAREWYSIQRSEDGLTLPWHVDRQARRVRTVWVNPPYCNGALPVWVTRAIELAELHDLAIWMLIPAATDTEYGQAALTAASDVLFVNGRVQHLRADGAPKGSPEFGSMIVAFGRASCASMRDLGVVLGRTFARREAA